MIDFIGRLLFFPFLLIGYVIKFCGYFLYAMVICIVWMIQIIINIIKFIVSLCSKKKYRPSYTKLISFGELKDNSNYRSKTKKVNKKSKFDEDADLWGLSLEDRKIAKEEGMSPADFVEAEERDDDELFTDEWE